VRLIGCDPDHCNVSLLFAIVMMAVASTVLVNVRLNGAEKADEPRPASKVSKFTPCPTSNLGGAFL